jgi:signal transduction histidine kinase
MMSESVNKRIKQLERLLEVGRNLSAMLELEPLLQTIIDAAADLTYSQESSILLYDKKEDNLQFVAAPWFKREKMREIRVPLDKSISGQVYTYGEPILVKNAQGDPRVFREVDMHSGFETRNMLAVPMKIKGEPTGVLAAVNKLNDQRYKEEDIDILETLASQAAIAIHNASLLRQAQEAYQELTQLDQAKGDFIAITSHELRTPLGLILGHATFMQEMVPEDLKSQMEVIISSSMRLKEIVDDLSKVNNFQTGQARVRKRQVNLNELLQEVVSSYQKRAEENQIHLELKLPDEVLFFEGDNEKISIAVSHLVRNAVTFNNPGGKVAVSVEKTPEYFKIDVVDTGIGIPSEDLDRIFERFYQVEEHMTRKHGGMGLGLSVAKMMVEMHKGRIGVHSNEGKGSTFSILLPILQPEPGYVPPFIE